MCLRKKRKTTRQDSNHGFNYHSRMQHTNIDNLDIKDEYSKHNFLCILSKFVRFVDFGLNHMSMNPLKLLLIFCFVFVLFCFVLFRSLP